MPEQMAEDADKPDLASVEVDLFGALLGFHQKTVTLLRQSSLNDEKRKLLSERINLATQTVLDELKRSKTWKLTGLLESAYEDIRRFAEELSSKEE